MESQYSKCSYDKIEDVYKFVTNPNNTIQTLNKQKNVINIHYDKAVQYGSNQTQIMIQEKKLEKIEKEINLMKDKDRIIEQYELKKKEHEILKEQLWFSTQYEFSNDIPCDFLLLIFNQIIDNMSQLKYLYLTCKQFQHTINRMKFYFYTASKHDNCSITTIKPIIPFYIEYCMPNYSDKSCGQIQLYFYKKERYSVTFSMKNNLREKYSTEQINRIGNCVYLWTIHDIRPISDCHDKDIMDDCKSRNKNLNIGIIAHHYTCLKNQYYAELEKNCVLNKEKYPNQYGLFNDCLQIVLKNKHEYTF